MLHGVGPDDAAAALGSSARPVLNSAEQVARWKEIAPGRPCDVMIDTGMNRLGLRPEEIGGPRRAGDRHADEPSRLRRRGSSAQRDAARAVPRGRRGGRRRRRYSLANSAGICLGRDYSFDLVRPGLALYGGIPRREAAGHIRQVARVEAQIVQRRTIRAGESCGYGATFVAEADTEAAILNIGYADGYLRGFSARGSAFAGEFALPVLGRVSMDLIAVGCDAAPDLKEGDWVELDYDLPEAAAQSGLSQYELLTTPGRPVRAALALRPFGGGVLGL